MALSYICRDVLGSVGVVILLTGAALMFAAAGGAFGYPYGDYDYDGNRRRTRIALLSVFGVVAVALSIVVVWLSCCFRRKERVLPFVIGITVASLIFIGVTVVMIYYGVFFLVWGETLPGALVVAFSVVPLAGAIAVPIICCCHRRRREIQEEDEQGEEEEQINKPTQPTNTEAPQPAVPINDDKVSV